MAVVIAFSFLYVVDSCFTPTRIESRPISPTFILSKVFPDCSNVIIQGFNGKHTVYTRFSSLLPFKRTSSFSTAKKRSQYFTHRRALTRILFRSWTSDAMSRGREILFPKNHLSLDARASEHPQKMLLHYSGHMIIKKIGCSGGSDE